jgi:chromosome partitioning protein
MRIDTRTRTPQVLKEWANGLGMPFLGVLRESQAYVQCLERGMTLFDLPAERVPTDLREWQPILGWLAPQLSIRVTAKPAHAQPLASPAMAPAKPLLSPRMSPPPAAAAPLPSRLLARPAAPAPASEAVSTPSVSAVRETPAIPSRLLASRPVPAVTRIGSPRVLDRVANQGGLRNTPSHQRMAESVSEQDSPPIPSFLKLVKC